MAYGTRLLGQPLPPVAPMYGVGDREFFIGAWVENRPDTNDTDPVRLALGMGRLWEFCRSMEITTMRRYGPDESVAHIDSLYTSPLRDTAGDDRNRLILSFVPYAQNAGFGRDAVFFLHPDTIRFRQWKCKFTGLAGGRDTLSAVEFSDFGNEAIERVYEPTNTTANQRIAWGIAFDWRPAQLYRFAYESPSLTHRDDSIQNSHFFLSNKRFKDSIQYVTVTGHLFSDGTASLTDDLIRIEIWYEIPEGGKWRDKNGIEQTASNNVEYLYATRYVRKSDLFPPGSPQNQNWDAYREVSLPFDAYWQDNGAGGPLHPQSTSRRIDVRVYWTGKEKLALRSIALRDSLAEQMLGVTAASSTYRDALLDRVRRRQYGPNWQNTTLPPKREDVIGVTSGIEQPPVEAASYVRSVRLLNENPFTDSIPAWTEGGDNAAFFQIYPPNVATAEFGMDWMKMEWLAGEAKTPHVQTPSIAEHNGGRFSIPLLNIWNPPLDSALENVEHRYTTTLQRIRFKQYMPLGQDLPGPFHLGGVYDVGRAAEVARDRRRRLVLVPFTNGRIYVRRNPETDRIDATYQDSITVSHFPEPAELRAVVNMGLCYGARGVLWQTLESHTNFMSPDLDPTFNKYTGGIDNFSACGPFSSDTTVDVFPMFRLRSPGQDGWYQNAVQRDSIANFFVGWRTRSRAVKEINRWLKQIGPVMTTLDWRDGYSTHFTTLPPYNTSLPYRPLPSTEIVNAVKSFGRRWTISNGVPQQSLVQDSSHATYVELGFFHKKNATTNWMRDTHHVLVVNRRTFDRTDDTNVTLARRERMDSLAEMRVIELRLNVPGHPIEDSLGYEQYAFVRVREVEPDLTPLPLTTTSRIPLDTVVRHDSVVKLTLGPGRAALLRITYAQPDTSIHYGDLRFNNQRKMVWDGRRYHATYWRHIVDTLAGTSRQAVFYRRSLPIIDTTGAILWQPTEHELSTSLVSGDTLRIQNVFPSLTLRTVKGDTVVSVVWTCHSNNVAHAGKREIVLRNVFSASSSVLFGPIEVVNWHRGLDSTKWGTPVICRYDGGEFIAWSDSVVGIVATKRALDTVGKNWWRTMTAYSAPSDVSSIYSNFGPGQYPSLPISARVAAGDSTCGLVWQQPYLSGMTFIPYARLVHSGNSPNLYTAFYAIISENPDRHRYPAIDLVQNNTGYIEEGVVWETPIPGGRGLNINENFRGVSTTAQRINGVQQFTNFVTYAEAHYMRAAVGNLYPSVAWIGPSSRTIQYTNPPLFSVACQTGLGFLANSRIHYLFEDIRLSSLYTFDGVSPATAASLIPQSSRQGILYQSFNPWRNDNSLLRTSREFFARVRPGGYTAEGREVTFRLWDSISTAVTVMMHDVWIADASVSRGIGMTERGTTSIRIDSLPQVHGLMRTDYFHAHDSTQIGLWLSARFHGNTLGLNTTQFRFVAELCDSITNLAVRQLDSFAIVSVTDTHDVVLDPVFDLLSGTYYIRLRVEPVNYTPVVVSHDSRYPIAEVSSWVDDPPLSKLRREDGAAGTRARISAQPNPFTASTEIRFSVPVSDYASVTLYDQFGRVAAQPLRREEMEAGRYTLDFDGSTLPNGTYLLVLQTSSERIVEKVALMR